MDNSVGSTIEKIKLQEIEVEAKLKEKRELETNLASLNRSIRDANLQYEKYKEEEIDLINKTNLLRSQIELEKIHKEAYSLQVIACHKEFEELRSNSNEGIAKVWEQRASLCDAVQIASDKCDVWNLLMRPTWPELTPKPKKSESSLEDLVFKERLKKAMERREKAVEERNRLMTEPDTGEEFVRIKNALRFSLEKLESLLK